MKNINTFVPMETKDRERALELAAGSSQATITDSTKVGSSKRVAEAELDHEGSKRQKTNEALGSWKKFMLKPYRSNIQSLTGRFTLKNLGNIRRSSRMLVEQHSEMENEMDVKSTFLYGKIEEEVYVCQPPGFEDPDFPDRVYKVEKAFYGLYQAPRAWYETLSTYLLDNRFQRGKIDKTLFIKRDKGLQVKQKKDGIFISQDKYMTKILKKFGFSDVKTASTPMETHKPLLKDADGKDVDEHLYRSMIGSLMYLTSLRPGIMFAVSACARFQVNPKNSHLHDVKRIFRYLKGQPKLGLWYPKDSPFDLVAYTDNDYAGAILDRKSTT
ncbi:putative ribonuclease H-like domain-containing protein [Tanacetum coccineum]|uniref:Ribonuclease H-like domain-containing protein n=1 Tax=Tanacetum coccineum TaxID=301880 RepID=A0ABQ5AUW2_9ASTR